MLTLGKAVRIAGVAVVMKPLLKGGSLGLVALELSAFRVDRLA